MEAEAAVVNNQDRMMTQMMEAGGWTNGETNERTDRWMTGQTERRKDGRADGRGLEAQTSRWLYRWMMIE